MAIRFTTAASDQVSYSAEEPPETFTYTAWIYISQSTGGYSSFMRLRSSTEGTVASFSTLSSGLGGVAYYSTSGSVENAYATPMFAGTWYRVAFTRTGTTGQVYLAEDADGPIDLLAGGVSALAPAGITLGGRGPSDNGEQYNGRLAHVRAWASVLTQAEIEDEWSSPTPVRAAGLWVDWPLATAEDLTDHSGNGRHLTAGTTPVTTEEGPPIVSEPPTPIARHWDGSTWADVISIRHWNGATWQDVPTVRRWDGSAWVEIGGA